MSTSKVTFQPSEINVTTNTGTVLKDVMHSAGIPFDFPCGGRGKCGKCRVQITSGAADPTEGEAAFLTPEELEEGVRLACLTPIMWDTTVELPAERREHQILLSSLKRTAVVEPHIKKHYLEADKPAMTDHRSDWRRVTENLQAQGAVTEAVSAPVSVLRKLPAELRKAAFALTAVCYKDEIRGLEAGNTSDVMLGMAFDIGTTTIVGYLLDLYTGRELAVVSMLNPQTRYGGDVISRITYANQHENGLDELHTAVTGALNQLIGEATENAAVRRADVYAVAVAGNTCMHHLFLGISPRQVALAPYVPAVNDPVAVEPTDVRLEMNPAGKVFVLPNIAGFVGADTVAVILATEMDKSDTVKLMIDIGTNGEIAVGDKHGLVACSAAAGPAFEGAQISCGMRGATGAIDHVSFDDGLDYSVIGKVAPLGVCGSALLDTVALLLEAGIITAKGKFTEPEDLTNPIGLKLKERVIRHNNSWAFLLTDEADGKQIMITQKDIRELQLAKGAMAAGIRILMETKGVRPEDIDEVLLAGAFGNYLNPHSACVIGLIPMELEHKITMVGNAAGAGAKLALLSSGEYHRAKQMTGNVTFVELGSDRNFTNIFASSMLFPELN